MATVVSILVLRIKKMRSKTLTDLAKLVGGAARLQTPICLPSVGSVHPTLLPLRRIPFLLPSPPLPPYPTLQTHQAQNSPLSQQPTWSHRFSERLISLACSYSPYCFFTLTCVVITHYVHTLPWALGMRGRARHSPHGVRGLGASPSECSTHHTVSDCRVTSSCTCVWSPCSDSKLMVGRTTFIHVAMHPSPLCFSKHPGNSGDV